MQSTKEPGNPDEPPKVKRSRTVYKPSCKAGCRAKMVVHKMMEDHLINRARLRVTYYYRHTGHSLGDVDDFQHLRMTDDIRARIRNLVRLGRQAGALFGQGSQQRDHVPIYDDVYVVCHKYWSETIKLNGDDLVSMHAWMHRLKEEKQFTVFEWHRQQDKSKFALGFMSPFQKHTFQGNHECIGLDSTYGTNRKKHELFTIVVQDPVTMKAIP
ncbi:hypothetical protein BGX23_005361, partial [Mortierella sp. AD031]